MISCSEKKQLWKSLQIFNEKSLEEVPFDKTVCLKSAVLLKRGSVRVFSFYFQEYLRTALL